MEDPELIVNLWYVYDDLGFIYQLRGRAYLGYGTDEEKLKFLHQFATKDYLIAKSFSVPERYSTNFTDGITDNKIQAISINDVKIGVGFDALFEDVYKALNEEIPDRFLSISQSPLRVLTPLFYDSDGSIYPKFEKTEKI